MNSRIVNGLALNHAIKNRDIEEVKKIIADNAPNLNFINSCFNNNNEEDQAGFSLLYCAVEKNHLEIVQELLWAGANPNLTCTALKISPLHLAAFRCSVEVAKLLIEFKANLTLKDKDGNLPVDYVSSAFDHHIDMLDALKAFVDIRASVYQQKSLDKIRIMGGLAIYNATKEENLKKVKELIEKKVPLDLCFNAAGELNNKTGYSSLYCAAQKDNIKIVEELLWAGAEVNLPNSTFGDMPLHMAAKNCSVKVAELLLEFNADVHSENIFGKKPIDYVDINYFNHSPMIETLKKAGATHRIKQNQSHFIKNFNYLLSELQKHGLLKKLSPLNKDGVCNGKAKAYVLYSEKDLEDEFSFMVKYINQFNQKELEKEVWYLLIHLIHEELRSFCIKLHEDETKSYSFGKLLDFIEIVSEAQKLQNQNFYRSIDATWEKNQIICFRTNELPDLLKSIRVLERRPNDRKQYKFVHTGIHALVIKLTLKGNYYFEPNRVDGEVLFKDEHELSNFLRSVTADKKVFGLSINEVSYKNENTKLDNHINQFNDIIQSHAELRTLTAMYRRGSISRYDLAFTLNHQLIQIAKTTSMLAINEFQMKLTDFLQKEKMHGDHLFVVHFAKIKKEENTIALQNQLLGMACQYGNLKRMIELINLGVSVNLRRDFDGSSHPILHTATDFGNLPMVQFLLARGADINAKKLKNGVTRKESPIMIAAQNGFDDIVKFLLSKGAHVGFKGNKNLVLKSALKSYHEKTIMLIKQNDVYNQNIKKKMRLIKDKPIALLISDLLCSYACPPFLSLSSPSKDGHRYLVLKLIANKLKSNLEWTGKQCLNFMCLYISDNSKDDLNEFSEILHYVDQLINLHEKALMDKLFSRLIVETNHLNINWSQHQLDEFQSKASRVKGARTWLLQGPQMVKNQQMIPVIFFRIASIVLNMPGFEMVSIFNAVHVHLFKEMKREYNTSYLSFFKSNEERNRLIAEQENRSSKRMKWN